MRIGLRAMVDQKANGGQRLGRRLALVLAMLVAVLAATATAALVANREHHDLADRRDRIDGGAIDDGLVMQNTAVDAFLQTNDDTFLDQYDEATTLERNSADAVAEFARGVDGAIVQLDLVRASAEAWRSTASAEIVAARSGVPDVDPDFEIYRRRLAEFATSRHHVQDLDHLLDRTIESLDDRSDRAAKAVGIFAFAGLGLGVVILVVSIFELRRLYSRPLALLAEAVAAVTDGHLEGEIPVVGADEIKVVGAGAEQMRQRLLGELDEAVRSSVAATERAERERLAGELHDDPVQTVFAAQLRLSALRHEVSPQTMEKIDAVGTSLMALQQRLRSLMFRLHPSTLDSDGLVEAVRDLLDEAFATSPTEPTLDSPDRVEVDQQTAVTAFRLIAEATRNTAKHSSAARLRVTIVDKSGGILGEVADDGVGFDVDGPRAPGHHGTDIGRSLAEAVGGWWSIKSTEGAGTTVRFWIPG